MVQVQGNRTKENGWRDILCTDVSSVSLFSYTTSDSYVGKLVAHSVIAGRSRKAVR